MRRDKGEGIFAYVAESAECRADRLGSSPTEKKTRARPKGERQHMQRPGAGESSKEAAWISEAEYLGSTANSPNGLGLTGLNINAKKPSLLG